MSTPAGWYDDGSGRQRWWDGQQWTEHYAPAGEQAAAADDAAAVDATAAPADADAAPAYAAAGYSAPAAPVQTTAPVRRTAVLGFIGLGLAVVGTVLACIPNVLTFAIACVVLLAAFVVSLIAVFQKGTAKWPSITGMALAVVGGIIGIVVLVVTLATAIAKIPMPPLPTDFPSSPGIEQPSDPPADGQSDGRPSPEEIAHGVEQLAHEGGVTDYDDKPDFYPCVGQYLYDSDLSDEALRATAAGEDLDGAEREKAIQIGVEATVECSTP
ncbi:DUF2510 domain-containing protein [Microbacterium sp. ARD32]|uniref:DUF2510 domain-containing protein n=1 Tax=Microbacterium sp. ARD32 TaxID=2962577 RepID=UPI002881A1B9|nr:DUF2510 domain-containing protein [Microbacterium sp. ARD32]MDT0156132.1 DUF2510 domain-containing protein [Microbacterium sp. ARD32]